MTSILHPITVETFIPITVDTLSLAISVLLWLALIGGLLYIMYREAVADEPPAAKLFGEYPRQPVEEDHYV